MNTRFLLFNVVLLLTSCTNHNTEIPADFPSDVPIISGDIYRAEHARFEDGPGFVVDILTTLSCEEVYAFYASVVGPREDGDVRVETTCGTEESRYVSIAVHLGGATGINQEEYERVRSLRPDAGFVELVEEDVVD